jgi:pimeloyl-ACP methyl ester carboxylesterase
MTPSTLVLVHSPLVGPSTWRPFEDTARAAGLDVVRPDLTGVDDAGRPAWHHLVDTTVEAVSDRSGLVVIGHSGAGAVLPAIGHRLADRVRTLVFVDAIIPPAVGEHRASEPFLDFLDDIVVDGLLPQWLDWWPPDVGTSLVPSPTDLDELRADMPRLHRSFYDDPVPVPPDWTSGPCAYLRSSPAYDDELRRAGEFGWPTATTDGSHLSVFTDPAAVFAAVRSLVRRALRPASGSGEAGAAPAGA